MLPSAQAEHQCFMESNAGHNSLAKGVCCANCAAIHCQHACSGLLLIVSCYMLKSHHAVAVARVSTLDAQAFEGGYTNNGDVARVR
jgi:hypothetical protein